MKHFISFLFLLVASFSFALDLNYADPKQDYFGEIHKQSIDEFLDENPDAKKLTSKNPGHVAYFLVNENDMSDWAAFLVEFNEEGGLHFVKALSYSFKVKSPTEARQVFSDYRYKFERLGAKQSQPIQKVKAGSKYANDFWKGLLNNERDYGAEWNDISSYPYGVDWDAEMYLLASDKPSEYYIMYKMLYY